MDTFRVGQYVSRRDNGVRGRILSIENGMVEIVYVTGNRSIVRVPVDEIRPI